MQHKLCIVCGPTATGKTTLAVHLAKKFHGELVSADSRHVYKGIDILTGKDTQEFHDVPIHMIDILSPGERYSVSQYHRHALHSIQDIYARKKLPILVGGTGLYIKAIVQPFETMHIPPDQSLRKQLEARSVAELKKELGSQDKSRYTRMNASDRNNPRRLIRALEIVAWNKSKQFRHAQTLPFDIYWIGITRSLDGLRERIAKRVRIRWQEGAIAEASRNPHAVATGIIPIQKYLQGICTKEQAIDQWIREEIAYAKRQMTWFKKEKNIRWYDAGNGDIRYRVEKDVGVWYTGR